MNFFYVFYDGKLLESGYSFFITIIAVGGELKHLLLCIRIPDLFDMYLTDSPFTINFFLKAVPTIPGKFRQLISLLQMQEKKHLLFL